MTDDSTTTHPADAERLAALENELLDLKDALRASEQQREVLENFCFGLEKEYETAQQTLRRTKDELEQSYAKLQAQQRDIMLLGVPILDVARDIVALPIIGTIDEERAAHMTETLLQRVATRQVRSVILDLTAVDGVDTRTAQHLAAMIASVRLLGAFCVVTGIGPDVAGTMVTMDIELGDAPTLRTLREGLELCVRQLARRRAARR